MKKREAKLSELAEIISLNFYGENVSINGLGLCNRTTEYSSILSYMTSLNYVKYAIENSAVSALVVSADIYEKLSVEYINRFSFIVSEHPEDDFYNLHKLLNNNTCFYEHPNSGPVIGIGCNIHPTVIIENGVTIGEYVEIGAYSVISRGVIIGDNCHIGRLSVIGSQGFQAIKRKDGSMYNVVHVGGSEIGNNVWIGDNVTVCNALFEGNVVIGDNSLIDNHTQIAHNCVIGSNNVLTAGVIMLGSSILKNNCWLAPGAMVMNRVTVEDFGFVGTNSVANTDVKSSQTVIGTPAITIDEYAKIRYAIKKLIKK